jgi:hypothetical protein
MIISSIRWDVGEVGGHPVPGQYGAEGQSRTKQDESLGVRNESGPTSKEKMDSDLHGNMQSMAEMTIPPLDSGVTTVQYKVHSLASAC